VKQADRLTVIEGRQALLREALANVSEEAAGILSFTGRWGAVLDNIEQSVPTTRTSGAKEVVPAPVPFLNSDGLTIGAKSLREALKIVEKGVSGRCSRPVQQNVYIAAQPGSLRLVATDLEFLSFDLTMPCEGEGGFDVTVPARALVGALGNGKNGESVTLSVDERNSVTVRRGSASQTIRGLPAADFETMPKLSEGAREFVLPAQECREVLNSVLSAVSTDETRPNLCGVLFECQPASERFTRQINRRFEMGIGWVTDTEEYFGDPLPLTLTTSDTHRLIQRALPGLAVSGDLSVIVAARPLHFVVTLIGKSGNGEVRFRFSDTQMEALWQTPEGWQLRVGSRLIEGQFPSYQKVIPDSHERVLTFDHAEFARALKEDLLPIAREDARRVTFKLEDETCELTADAQDVGKASTVLPVEVEGDALIPRHQNRGLPLPPDAAEAAITEPFESAFNVDYMLDALEAMPPNGGKARLEMMRPLDPFVLRNAEANWQHVLMPMRFSDSRSSAGER